jgi:lipoyl(octanoyl) transferase
MTLLDSPPETALLPAAEWRIAAGLVPYPEAVATMEARVAGIAAHEMPEAVWLVEHPPL